ncbi:short-chain dehydrogenase [Aureimonas sp. Leaf454]|uniref:short chain dehydrogenase n=1 Tax=Aureimonas sp. Leaf454 TaxID=1736381 RepID=UPI0006F8411C|nr:short chain dehydrogenase [Aureimonas sp. Leaf454]KQT54795.1 short-chain dehydrogenase [Aureimonas sp. Leaf454]
MRVVLIGASGTIGQAIDAELGARHEIVRVNRTSGDATVDMTDALSVKALFETIGAFDALVCASGKVHFGALQDFTPELYAVGLGHKLMGQVNLVTFGTPWIRDGGSFTLTSGLLNDDPILEGVSAAMVNGAIDGFVRGAAVALPRGLRINVVSPTVITQSMPSYGPFFRGVKPVPADEAALAYARSVEGAHTGRVYRVGWTRDH